MSHSGCRSNACRPAARGASIYRFALCALLPLAAAPPAPAPPPRSALTQRHDLRAQFRGSQALLDDPQLAALRLMVRVHGGTATVSGDAPTAELARKAVEKLKGVNGIYAVKNDIVVRPRPVEPLPLTFRPDPPTRTQSASLNPLSQPVPDSPPPAPPTAPGVVSLSGPVPLAKPPHKAPGVPVSVRPAPAAPLAAAVERVRQGDARFRPIRAEVRGKAVLLYGGGARPEDVTAFAQAVSRLPGVEDVMIQSADGP